MVLKFVNWNKSYWGE